MKKKKHVVIRWGLFWPDSSLDFEMHETRKEAWVVKDSSWDCENKPKIVKLTITYTL